MVDFPFSFPLASPIACHPGASCASCASCASKGSKASKASKASSAVPQVPQVKCLKRLKPQKKRKNCTFHCSAPGPGFPRIVTRRRLLCEASGRNCRRGKDECVAGAPRNHLWRDYGIQRQNCPHARTKPRAKKGRAPRPAKQHPTGRTGPNQCI